MEFDLDNVVNPCNRFDYMEELKPGRLVFAGDNLEHLRDKVEQGNLKVTLSSVSQELCATYPFCVLSGDSDFKFTYLYLTDEYAEKPEEDKVTLDDILELWVTENPLFRTSLNDEWSYERISCITPEDEEDTIETRSYWNSLELFLARYEIYDKGNWVSIEYYIKENKAKED